MTVETDQLLRFSFENVDIRGEFVRLTDAYRHAANVAHGGPVASRLLGEGLCAAAILGNSLKHDGLLALQTSGDGAARFVLAECRNRTELRGMVQLRDDSAAAIAGPADLLGEGHLAITIEPEGGRRYQGITALVPTGFADAIANYFEQSEQLPTRFRMAAGTDVVAGLMLQVLPDTQPDNEFEARKLERDWEILVAGAEGLDAALLLEAPVEALLTAAFPVHPVRLHRPATPLAFQCTCSRARTGRALLTLPPADVTELLEETGWIEVNCEFCGTAYRFGRTELAELADG